MSKNPDPFDFIQQPSVGNSPGNSASASANGKKTFAEEVSAFDADGDDVVYERKVQHAFLVRELKQIDEIVVLRKDFADKIYDLIVNWLIGIALLIFCSAWKVFDFELDTKVMLALLGGTTISVIGIFMIVANFMFPKSGHAIFSRNQRKNKKNEGDKKVKNNNLLNSK